MGKGGIAMRIEKTWSANSKPAGSDKTEGLANMAGQWGIGIEVSITKPYRYSKGPVERKIREKESLPPPSNE
jgi:hypothetical protein